MSLRQRMLFVHAAQRDLLQRALAPWPRRSAPLLEINCGNGAFLSFLWRCGFDILATENDQEQRMEALNRTDGNFEIRAAGDNDLPFEEDSFDWAILHLKNGDPAKIRESALEALRVCKRGLMLTFWNVSSLSFCMEKILHKKKALPVPAFAWRQVWRLMSALRMGRLCGMTTLCGPKGSWNRHCWFSGINRMAPTLPVGSWAIIRADFSPSCNVTPLAIRWKEAIKGAEPAMEYSHKNITNPENEL